MNVHRRGLAGVQLVTLLLASATLGQGESDRLLRFLPVGESPPFQVVERNGVRLEVEPEEGSVPPRRVVHVLNSGEEKGSGVPLRLNQVSPPILVSRRSVTLHESGRGGTKAKAWHTVDMPKNTAQALAILWRDPDEKTWAAARSLTLLDDLQSFPAGMVRIINASPWPAEVEFDGEKLELPAGESVQRGSRGIAIAQVEMEVKVLVPTRGTTKSVRGFSGSVTQSGRERCNVIVYKTDRSQSRRPVKVLVRPEAAQLAKAPRR